MPNIYKPKKAKEVPTSEELLAKMKLLLMTEMNKVELATQKEEYSHRVAKLADAVVKITKEESRVLNGLEVEESSYEEVATEILELERERKKTARQRAKDAKKAQRAAEKTLQEAEKEREEAEVSAHFQSKLILAARAEARANMEKAHPREQNPSLPPDFDVDQYMAEHSPTGNPEDYRPADWIDNPEREFPRRWSKNIDEITKELFHGMDNRTLD